MSSFLHIVAEQTISLYLITLSFLGWNIKEATPLPSPPISGFENQATSTVVVNKPKPLPYLKIVAPEFSFIPINRPVTPKPTPLPTVTPVLTATPTPVPTEIQLTSVKDAIVNIYCTIRNGNTITAITGSGVLISSKGVVITNAHVAQYVLLADYYNSDTRSCEVRTGAIAKSSYETHVLYISPDWVKNNVNNLKDSNPKGTGEFDYAFLEIENGVKKLPNTIPYLDFSSIQAASGNSVTAIGYPAGHLDSQAVVSNLHKMEDSTIIDKTYSFGYSNSDLLVAQTDALAQRGSSGGAVIDSSGNLAGIISTSIPNNQTGHTSLAALTTSYIAKDYYNTTGESLSALLSQNPVEKYKYFENFTGFALARTLLGN